MSLIEKALGKAKESAIGAELTAPALKRPMPSAPATRVALEPQLRITESILERLGIDSAGQQEHQRSSEYRHIKRRVVAEIRTDHANRVVLIASALPGEGKSFTSANLARSLAMEPDFSVLLVDADVIKPQISKAMTLANRPGLMDALVDPNCDVESLVVSTDIVGLSVLPAGSANEFATEYFASERMNNILARLLAVPRRIIVIDSLPLLLTTEARALAPLAGQVLLVVRAESTSQSAVQQAIELMGEKANVKVILNAAVRNKLARYLGYNYGFDYDYVANKTPGESDE